MFRKLSTRVRRTWASIALLSVEMTFVLGVFFVALIGFAYIVRRVFVLENNSFDQQVFDYLEQFVTPGTNQVMKFITFFGTHRFLIPANLGLIAWFLFIRRHKWYSIKIPAIGLSSLVLMAGLKHLFGRQRPLIPLLEPARGLSFPSGHALMSMTFYGMLIYITWHSVKDPRTKWTLIVLLFLWILAIGFSRIYLRVHYTSDVLAGFAMGWLWIVLALKSLRFIEKKSKLKLNPVVEAPKTDSGQAAA
ncbi:MAG: phosphatase PAP2 family protein [Chitinophagaceae bacterium]|nr:MAG: phosphatase PAP2 family protein [Chitinophagaceae bacterium]